MGSICLHSTQVTAKNSINVKSPCFGTAAETVVATGDETAVAVATISTCAVVIGVTAGVDGEHAVPSMISIKRKGMNFRDMDEYQ